MRNPRQHALLLQLLIIASVFFPATEVFSQEPPPALSLVNLRDLLSKKVKEEEIIKQIQLYKVNFTLKEALELLLDARATRQLYDAIEENPFRPLFFTFPSNRNVVSPSFQVEGWTRVSPDKHLWLFVHREGDVDWVPQEKEVVPDQSGTWKHIVVVGEEKDSDLTFEIKAVWVEPKTHKELVTHLQSHCKIVRNEKYARCPGIKLPEGTPTAQVTILRRRK